MSVAYVLFDGIRCGVVAFIVVVIVVVIAAVLIYYLREHSIRLFLFYFVCKGGTPLRYQQNTYAYIRKSAS